MLAQKLDCQYTRYADDITISIKDNENLGSLYKLKQLIVKILGEEGFQENTKKTEYKRRNQRKTVTGIVVNEKLNPRRWYYLRTRAAAHQYSTQDKKEQRSTRGKILYVGNINSRKGELLIQMIEKGYEQAELPVPESEQGWINSRKKAWVAVQATV
jgi:retron-type reverse transcriptase